MSMRETLPSGCKCVTLFLYHAVSSSQQPHLLRFFAVPFFAGGVLRDQIGFRMHLRFFLSYLVCVAFSTPLIFAACFFALPFAHVQVGFVGPALAAVRRCGLAWLGSVLGLFVWTSLCIWRLVQKISSAVQHTPFYWAGLGANILFWFWCLSVLWHGYTYWMCRYSRWL